MAAASLLWGISMGFISGLLWSGVPDMGLSSYGGEQEAVDGLRLAESGIEVGVFRLEGLGIETLAGHGLERRLPAEPGDIVRAALGDSGLNGFFKGGFLRFQLRKQGADFEKALRGGVQSVRLGFALLGLSPRGAPIVTPLSLRISCARFMMSALLYFFIFALPFVSPCYLPLTV